MEDVIIRGGAVIDGTGHKGYRADVAVREGVITAVGNCAGLSARQILDADGLAVAPGFIDAHAHSDTSFLLCGSSASKLYQGITTEISGNCGASPFPASPDEKNEWQCFSFDGFVKKFEESGLGMAVNQALLVGHGSLRSAVIGGEGRKAAPEEMEQMKALLFRDLKAGAWGLSLGLEYAPGFFADRAELCALGQVVRQFDGLVPCHMRSEGLAIDAAIQELLDIGRFSGVRVHVSHLKLDNFRVHGRADQVWSSLDQARREGIRISADMYPYTASCTTLGIRCPQWSREGGGEALARRLQGDRRNEIVEGIRLHYFNAERADTCLINDDGGLWPEIVGKTLRFTAENLLHTDDYAQAAAEILVRTRGKARGIFFVMSEDDMLYFLSRDIGIGTDAGALSADPARVPFAPHPRAYGAVSEFFRLARERGLCSLEEAVRRVTSKAADVIGLKDRGRIREGLAADITVFDPAAIGPRTTYLDPIQLSRGVVHMLVNGQIALRDGAQTDVRAGRFLRKGIR